LQFKSELNALIEFKQLYYKLISCQTPPVEKCLGFTIHKLECSMSVSRNSKCKPLWYF